MRTYIFDIEADNLLDDVTKVHCLSISYESQGIWVTRSTTKKEEIINFMTCEGVKIGHNIICYDIPVLEKLYNTKMKGVYVDTLALSYYMYEHQKLHGLEYWGTQLGVEKVAIDDWENLTIEQYIQRCETDVEINKLLWLKFKQELQQIYERWDTVQRLIQYLNFKMTCIHLQEVSRWRLDVEKCQRGLEELSALKEQKVQELQAVMPRVEKKATKKRPAKIAKKDGSPTVDYLKWIELCDNTGTPYDSDTVEYVSKYEEPKATGFQQVKDWLYSLGWKPETFKHLRDKETGNVRRIEQIKKGDDICPSVLALVEKEPAIAVLDGLTVLTHRIGILKGFLKSQKDGYVRAGMHGFTTTLRLKHREVVNLPKVGMPYGELVRGCLIAPEGYELVGSDMSSLENRTRDHYIYPYDPEYVKELQSEGYDSHIALAVKAGFMTVEEGEWFKEKTIFIEQHDGVLSPDEKAEYGRLKKERGKGKQANFSAVYLVGPQTLSRSTGMSVKESKELLDVYWDINWSVKRFAQDLKTKKVGDRTWILNPVNQFWYILRNDKDRFSAINQATGVYVFDTQLKNVIARRRQLTGQFHDELILCVKKGYREQVRQLLADAIEQTNKELKLNVEMGISIAFGDSYADVH